MPRKNQRTHSPEFKAKVALAAIKGDKTLPELASQYQLHPSVIQRWKKELLDGASGVFDNGRVKKNDGGQAEIAQLYKKIGQLTVERDFLAQVSDL